MIEMNRNDEHMLCDAHHGVIEAGFLMEKLITVSKFARRTSRWEGG